jgi:hypothetical protein
MQGFGFAPLEAFVRPFEMIQGRQLQHPCYYAVQAYFANGQFFFSTSFQYFS